MQQKLINSTVLITGGAGFIGSNLCEVLLAQTNQVICSIESFFFTEPAESAMGNVFKESFG